MTKKMGPKETERFFREGGKDALKDVHKGEPWDSAPLIVKVANPGDYGKIHRFVVVWDNKSHDHKACPFYHHMMNKKTVGSDCVKPTWLEVPDKKEREDAPAFVPWEEKEAKDCDRGLVQKLFVERKNTPKKEKPKKKNHQKKNKKERSSTKTDKMQKKTKKRTKRPRKAAKLVFSCKEEVTEKIRKILRVKRSTFGRKKTTSTAGISTSHAPRKGAARSSPVSLKDKTERLRMRKSVKTKMSVQRRREAKNVVGKVMGTLLDKVIRCVEDKLDEVNKVVEFLLEETVLGVQSAEACQGDDMVQRR